MDDAGSHKAPRFARRDRPAQTLSVDDLFGPKLQRVGAGVSAAGRPRLSMRLVLSLLYLKHAFGLSDEEVVARWSENEVWPFFSGMEYYQPRLPRDATQIGRFRTAIGEAGVEELLKATIDAAVQIKAAKPAEFGRVIVDSTVQEKAIAHPVDSRLLEIARHKVVKAAKAAGIELEQTFAKEGQQLRARRAVEPAIGHLKQDHRIIGWNAAGGRARRAMPCTRYCVRRAYTIRCADAGDERGSLAGSTAI